MDNEESTAPPCTIPERIFKAGEEPTGVRVTPYHKPFGIKQILSVLESDEIEKIRASPFGKLVELADKPSFSGRFGRYIISRQLKVAKKYEAWFVFAGKPIRFSLREFAQVTGLNCSRFKKRPKKRLANRNLKSKPYWGELFGTLKEVSVSSVILLLKNKSAVRPELRLKYAFLALLSSVILPTTHSPKISEDYAEMIKDIDAFFAYPWGRVAFLMLINSIKERKEVSLSQNTIALKGFVLALQLVMVEAVPALTEVVRDGSSSCSEDEYLEEEDIIDEENAGQKSISPGHARDIDAAGKAVVHSIICSGETQEPENTEFEWSDDEEDTPVDNLVKLIHDGFPFTHASFTGGATKLDVIRMREESKASLNRRSSKTKQGSSSHISGGIDVEVVAALVKENVKVDFSSLEEKIATLRESNLSFQTQVLSDLGHMLSKVTECGEKIEMLSDCVEGTNVCPVQRPNPSPSMRNAATQTNLPCQLIDETADGIQDRLLSPQRLCVREAPMGDQARGSGIEIAEDTQMAGPMLEERRIGQSPCSPLTSVGEEQSHRSGGENSLEPSLDPALLFPNPTFSLGLTQEERAGLDKVVKGCIAGVQEEISVQGTEDIPLHKEETGLACRKSTRLKNPPKSLLGNYECDKRFLNLGRKAVSGTDKAGGSNEHSAKFSILIEKMKKPFSIDSESWTLDSSELYEMLERATPTPAKVVDVILSHIGVLVACNSNRKQQGTCLFINTEFLSQISNVYSTFSKVSKKESFKFPDSVLVGGLQKDSFLNADRFYLPFNLDQKYWVGLCVDMSSWAIYILDNNISIRSDYMMNKEVRPLAQMFPYLAKQLGKHVASKAGKPLAIDRPRCIPQSNALTDSAVASLLFIEAHAVGGLDGCKAITADVIETEVERLAVTLYEGNVGPLGS